MEIVGFVRVRERAVGQSSKTRRGEQRTANNQGVGISALRLNKRGQDPGYRERGGRYHRGERIKNMLLGTQDNIVGQLPVLRRRDVASEISGDLGWVGHRLSSSVANNMRPLLSKDLLCLARIELHIRALRGVEWNHLDIF